MMADEIDIEAFRQLEQDLHRPDLRSSREAVSARLADDFLEFGSSGCVYNKAVVIDALAEEAPADRITVPEVHDFTAKMIAPDAVLVLYRSVRRSEGAEPAKTTLRSSIWKRADGQWKMFFHQGTIVLNR
jgi:hypothetical protein